MSVFSNSQIKRIFHVTIKQKHTFTNILDSTTNLKVDKIKQKTPIGLLFNFLFN